MLPFPYPVQMSELANDFRLALNANDIENTYCTA